MSNYSIREWQPGDDFGVLFSDQTAEDRSPAQISMMITEMTGVANRYGFDFSGIGTLQSLRNFFRVQISGLDNTDDDN